MINIYLIENIILKKEISLPTTLFINMFIILSIDLSIPFNFVHNSYLLIMIFVFKLII